MKRGTIFGLTILGVCAALLCVLAVVGIAALAKRGPVAAPQAQAESRPATKKSTKYSNRDSAPKGDPWPECTAVREYLRIHAHDPASVEVVEWIVRQQGDPMYPPGTFIVRVRIRAQNVHGALENQVWNFQACRGKVAAAFLVAPN